MQFLLSLSVKFICYEIILLSEAHREDCTLNITSL